MKKFIDASDLFLKKLGSYIDLFLAKVKKIFNNVYLYCILLIVASFLAIYCKIKHYNEIGDAVVIFAFSCFIFMFITVIGKIYYYSPKKQKLDIVMETTNILEKNDNSTKANSTEKKLLLIENEEKDFYRPSKKITSQKSKNLSKFYNSKAREFIDIAYVSEANFINLISVEKEISIEERIFVFSELTNEKIVNFLDGIRQVTGISRVQLAKLFKKRIESTGEIKKVNELKLNSSISQANKSKKG